MKYHLFTAALLIAAFFLYLAGFSGGGLILVAMGVMLEIAFWIRHVRRKARHKSTARLAAR